LSAALQDFEQLLKETDITKRAGRVATKCKSYVDKLTEIKTSIAALLPGLTDLRLEKSAFQTCDQACDLVYALNYYFRNCEKFIAFMVYLEAILIDVDCKVNRLLIGVPVGKIVNTRDDAPVPPRPSTILREED
jgi:hypothetical protein